MKIAFANFMRIFTQTSWSTLAKYVAYDTGGGPRLSEVLNVETYDSRSLIVKKVSGLVSGLYFKI